MTLYLIAEQDENGLFWIGTGETEVAMAKLLTETKRPLQLRSAFEFVGNGSDEMAYGILMRKMPPSWAKQFKDGAFAGDLKAVQKLMHEVAGLMDGKVGSTPPTKDIMARILAHLGCKQLVLAKIAGVSKAMVTRWLTGDAVPGMDHMLRIRAFAMMAMMPVPDTLFLGDFSPATKGKHDGKKA